MAIKNYTSDKPIERIFAELQHTLGTHGAKHISFEYGDNGKIQGVAFTIKVHDQFIPIKLPARVEKAQAVLKKQWDEGVISHKRGRESMYGHEQAYRVAWRNILDWVQTASAHCLHQWGIKPTVLDQRNPPDLHILALWP